MDNSPSDLLTYYSDKKIRSSPDLSYSEAQLLKNEMLWSNLATITVSQAISAWLATLSKLTAKNYASGMNKLNALALINPSNIYTEQSQLCHR